MKSILLAICLVINFNLSAKIINVFNTKTKAYETFQIFKMKAKDSKFIVLGEFHNDPSIQNAEGQIIEEVGQLSSTKSAAVMWEFLNFTEQDLIKDLFSKYKSNIVTAEEVITNTAGAQNLEYTAVIKAAKSLNAELVGLNLPRDLKQKVMKGGLTAIDSSLIPASHYLGGANYLERFEETMGGHVPPEKVQAYYLAQCLTDSVMAHHSLINQKEINFLVAGSFHTDYFDGTVEKLKKLTSDSVLSVKIVNSDKMDQEELNYYLNGDEKFGVFADYIIVTSEK